MFLRYRNNKNTSWLQKQLENVRREARKQFFLGGSPSEKPVSMHPRMLIITCTCTALVSSSIWFPGRGGSWRNPLHITMVLSIPTRLQVAAVSRPKRIVQQAKALNFSFGTLSLLLQSGATSWVIIQGIWRIEHRRVNAKSYVAYAYIISKTFLMAW